MTKATRFFAWVAFAAVPVLGCGGADASPDDDPTLTQDEDLTAAYKAKITTNPSPVTVGAPTSLGIALSGPHGRVKTFDLLHTQPMHFIAVSSDLEDFIHVHPVLDADGDLSTSTTFSRPEPYAVFMEYDPAGSAGEQLTRARIAPSGSSVVKPHLLESDAFGGSVTRTTNVAGTQVELVGAPGTTIAAKTPAHLVFRFRDVHGTPVGDLTNWLGMPAHAIVLSPDLKTFEHVHGMAESGSSSTTTGPVGVDLTLPKAGLYKIFLQFRRGTTVITAPFILKAAAAHGPPPPPPTCATMTCPTGTSCMVMGTPPAPMCM